MKIHRLISSINQKSSRELPLLKNSKIANSIPSVNPSIKLSSNSAITFIRKTSASQARSGFLLSQASKRIHEKQIEKQRYVGFLEAFQNISRGESFTGLVLPHIPNDYQLPNTLQEIAQRVRSKSISQAEFVKEVFNAIREMHKIPKSNLLYYPEYTESHDRTHQVSHVAKTLYALDRGLQDTAHKECGLLETYDVENTTILEVLSLLTPLVTNNVLSVYINYDALKSFQRIPTINEILEAALKARGTVEATKDAESVMREKKLHAFFFVDEIEALYCATDHVNALQHLQFYNKMGNTLKGTESGQQRTAASALLNGSSGWAKALLFAAERDGIQLPKDKFPNLNMFPPMDFTHSTYDILRCSCCAYA